MVPQLPQEDVLNAFFSALLILFVLYSSCLTNPTGQYY